MVSVLCAWLLLAGVNPVQSDDQYAVPEVDPTSVKAQESPEEDGRFELELRGAFGKGILLRQRSDLFAIQVRGRLQVRGTAATSLDDLSDVDGSFVVRRARLVIGGHFLAKQLSYYVQLGLGPFDLENDNPVPLRDAFFTWHALRDVNIRFGQQKVPFDRQRVASSSKQQLVDRSLGASELNLDRDLGVQVFSNDLFGLGWLSYKVGVFQGDGRNRVNTDFAPLVMGRLQLTPLGTFEDLVEGDNDRTPTPKVAIAVAGGYNHRSPRQRSTIGTYAEEVRGSFAHLTADAAFKWLGFSASGAVLYRQVTATGHATNDALAPACLDVSNLEGCPRSGIAAFGQIGLFVYRDLELAARAGYLQTWDTMQLPWEVGEPSWQAELGGGGGVYMLGHNLKIQADAFALPSSRGMDMQLRSQVQVYF
jgi:phosphate-selective porin OprO/OprP